MLDNATAVGCAISRYQANGGFNSYLVCDYNYNNILGGPVYVKGATASKCQTGVNPNYAGLCTVDEPINN